MKITNRPKSCTTNFGVSKVNAKFIRNLFHTLEFNTCRQIETYDAMFSLHALRKIALQFCVISKCSTLLHVTITQIQNHFHYLPS
jgi:hypothetical protein